ncbi:6-phosphofructokinase [Petroclostridium sp. X23]|jgi:6-phosphofructokinase 1|uniref:6-phosphofructokinase n=1 Tax=Petroclostridium sp. X23 TaxID=3045146 RepID=UPI0024ADBA78|nr:6-phosphofructokinase [Petroclostridium sp. X23]WHH60467.1 6-phosphofructokinase [Petroclostridium sp. X23]
MSQIKTIGVLTSGGDAPGMNAAIRAVVRTGIHHGLKVMGIRKGYNGLISGDIFEMNLRSVSDILHRGGTILHTARSKEFATEAGMQKAVTISRIFGIDGVIVIGGDGSFRGARDLSNLGVPTVGIPGTIDNDIACSEYTIGFDTALNTVKDAIDKIRDTATSHERCSVIEVMGAQAGYIALHVGIANGAEAIIVPEKKFDFHHDVIKPIIEGKNRGKRHDIIIVAEGVGGAVELAGKIQQETGIEARATILGHIQRGGSPTVMDRVIASQMGAKAVQLLKDGIGNRVVAMKDYKIVDYDIIEGLNMTKTIDDEMVELAKILSL